MRLLGFLFVIALILAAVGWFRGWFSVTTVEASNKSSISVTVDKDKFDSDAKAAAASFEHLSEKAAAAVKSLARKISTDESSLDGTVTEVKPPTRDFVVAAGTETIALHAGDGVLITRGGAAVKFDQLEPSARVTLTFKHAGERSSLARIEIKH